MARRESLSALRLSDSQRKKIEEELTAFYLDERGEDLGIIERQQLIEFIFEHIAPIIYNKALDDAKTWFTQSLDDMESDYYMLYKDTVR